MNLPATEPRGTIKECFSNEASLEELGFKFSLKFRFKMSQFSFSRPHAPL